MSDTEQPAPRAFISYSWSNSDHEKWVLDLATELRESGVDVTLDKWDLREGQEAAAFMESMVTDKTLQKVIIISDKQYTTKSNERQGGAGTEAQIISKELFETQDQSKFVALTTERDDKGQMYLPAYYTSRIYIDFSEQPRSADSFEQLLRWLFDKPLHERPALGKKPAFLDSEQNVRLATNTEFTRAQSAIKEGRTNALTAVQDFFAKMIEQLPLLRFEGDPRKDYETFKNNLAAFIPYRNQIIEIVNLIARSKLSIEYYEAIHRFIEDFMYLFEPPEGVNQWRETDFKNFKFWGYETFLYIVAILIKEREYDGFDVIITRPFYIQNSRRNDKTRSLSDLYFYSETFEYWNKAKELRRVSLSTDFIHERSTGSGVRFHYLAQADFILYFRAEINQMRGGNYDTWFPMLMIYHDNHSGPFEIFARAASAKELPAALKFLGLQDKSEFDAMILPFVDGTRRGPSLSSYSFSRFDPPILVGYDKLCTRP